MLERLRAVLVNSFVGAIALGWLFAQGVLHFAYVFSAPIASWLTRREFRGITVPAAFSIQDALPELIRSFSILLVTYLLLRWLYFRPVEMTNPASEQSA